MQKKKSVHAAGQRPRPVRPAAGKPKQAGRPVGTRAPSGAASVRNRPPSRKPPAGKPGQRKPPSRAQEISSLQKRRRKKHKRNYTLYYILLFLFLIITGTVLSLTVFFQIETITVQGSGIYAAADVLPLLGAEQGDNLIRVNTGRMEQELLKSLPQADSVEISRNFPSGLTVTISDGVSSAQMESGGSYYVVSQSGRILERNTEALTGKGVVITGIPLENAAEGEYVQDVLERNWQEASALAEEKDEEPPEKSTKLESLQILFTALRDAQYSDVSAVDLSDEVNLILYWQNRIEIRLGSFSELDYKLRFAWEVLTDEAYAEIIPAEACGILDAQSASSVMPFQLQDEIDVPGGGAGVWNWDDNLSEEEKAEVQPESSLESQPESSVQPEESIVPDAVESSVENP